MTASPVIDIGCSLEITCANGNVRLRSIPSDQSSFPLLELEVARADYDDAMASLQEHSEAKLRGRNNSYVKIQKFPHETTMIEHYSDGRGIIYMTNML